VRVALSLLPEYDRGRMADHGERAVVVGAGFAGLCAARVLVDCVSRVILLERDRLPEVTQQRRGVPQGPHVHALLTSGRAVLEDLLPGYSDDLIAAGAVENDLGSDWTLYMYGGYQADTPNPIPVVLASRPLFEEVLGRRVTELDGVEVRSPSQFLGYLTSETGDVVGVSVRDEHGEEATLPADVVVDATGRTSRTPKWLERTGYSAPPVHEIRVDIGYSTGFIERPPDDVRAVRVGEGGVSAGAFPVEDDRWQTGLVGRGDDHPPRDPQAMEAFAWDLPVPDVGEILEAHDWRPTPIAGYRFPSNRRYRYEDLDRFPGGLVVVGDAVASFNPIFGQGMTVAAFEALVLHDVVAEGGLEGIGRRFFERVGSVVDVPWFQVAAFDSAFPESSGPTPPGVDSYREYMSRVGRASCDDGELREAWSHVAQLERMPSSLLEPGIVRRVFDEPDTDGPRGEGSSDRVLPSLEAVGPLLEANLPDPEGVLQWPGVSSGSLS
jgi:flavin-dependent dehydrogenase